MMKAYDNLVSCCPSCGSFNVVRKCGSIDGEGYTEHFCMECGRNWNYEEVLGYRCSVCRKFVFLETKAELDDINKVPFPICIRCLRASKDIIFGLQTTLEDF